MYCVFFKSQMENSGDMIQTTEFIRRTRNVNFKAFGGKDTLLYASLRHGAERLYDFGLDSILPTINAAMSLDEALSRAEELYLSAAERTFRMLRAGMMLKK